MATDPIEQGRELFVAGLLDGAESLAREEMARAKASGDLAALGRARGLLADVAYDLLRYRAARDGFLQAAGELERVLGPEHLETRQARASAALALDELGDRDAAQQLLAVAEAGLAEPTAPITAESARLWLTIAVGKGMFGDHREQRRLAEGTLSAIEESEAKDDLALVATAELHLASALHSLGESQEALAAERRCVELRRRCFGNESSRVAMAAFGVVRMLVALGELGPALELATESMQTLRSLGVERQPRMSTAWATLGLVHVVSGDVATGTEHFETACRIEEKTFGAAHPSTASMLVMLAQVAAGTENWGKALGICQRIVPVLAKDPRQLDALCMACEIESRALLALGRHKEAAKQSSNALSLLSRGKADPERMARLGSLLAQAELLSGRRDRAETALETARAHAIDAFGAGSPEVAGLERQLELSRSGAIARPKGRA